MWKSFQLGSWLITAGIAWFLGYIYNVHHGGELSFLRKMYEHKIAVAEQVQAPTRVLIVGGSGANYATSAAAIEAELGIPVFNLGLDGPVGLNVILPSILEQVSPGDIVLLIPEDLILLDDDGLLDRSVPFGIAIGRPGLGDVPPQQLAENLLLVGTPTLRGLTKSTIDLIEKGEMTGYYSDPFTNRGDPTVTKVRQGKWWKWQIKEPISDHAIERITEFREQVEAKGATLVLSLPWVYASTEQESIANMRKIATELEKIAPVIAYDSETFNLKSDSSLFADTHHHLLPDSRKIRAKELAEGLEPFVKKDRNRAK